MKRQTIIYLGVLLAMLFSACDPEWNTKDDKYARPDWLAGKVYTQLLDQPDLSTFARCVELSGYDTIIDRSGTYTIFAPNNEAFDLWLSEKGHGDVDNIPLEELRVLVRYHLVQSPWSKLQLQSLDIEGWIDTLDVNNNEPRGYKRETFLLNDNRKLGVTYTGDDEIKIVDTLDSPWYRMYVTDSRKYSPVFFQDYFSIYNLNSSDYAFYYERPFEATEMFYAGGKIIGEEIFAENGFVYQIDEVIDPTRNAYEILEDDGEHSYALFLDLVNHFPVFSYDEEQTFDQPGADLGLEVDSLFNINFPELAFDLLNENTTPPRGTYGQQGNVTIRYHHGMAAPTDAALLQLEETYLAGEGKWGSMEEAPRHIKRIIANTHLSNNPIYPTDFSQGFLNGESDLAYIDESDILEKEYGSNATFIGLSEALVPRAFSSVTGPIYQERGYSFAMYAIEEAGLLAALKRVGEDYMLLVENDQDCKEDSSLLYDYQEEEFFLYQKGDDPQRFDLNVGELRTLILNHVGTRRPFGTARKEFVKNLAGNFLVVDNITGEVSGTAPTTEGYRGTPAQEFPELISDNADNGNTYQLSNWFSFSAPNLYLLVNSQFPEFHRLLEKSGLGNPKESRYVFLSENENYTVFAPTDSALLASGADTLPIPELQQLLMLHFVQGELIFTDGSTAPGYYETTRIDESSTQYNTVFTPIYIDPAMDLIHIKREDGGVYLSVEEAGSRTNRMAGRNLGEGTEVFPNVVVNAVVHECDQVLLIDELESN